MSRENKYRKLIIINSCVPLWGYIFFYISRNNPAACVSLLDAQIIFFLNAKKFLISCFLFIIKPFWVLLSKIIKYGIIYGFEITFMYGAVIRYLKCNRGFAMFLKSFVFPLLIIAAFVAALTCLINLILIIKNL